MRAIVQTGYGAPERVLALAEIPRPRVAADAVLIRVKATSVNTPDWIAVAGVPYVLRLQSGLRGPSTPVRGTDVAGVVAEVGRDVSDLRAGDEVFGSLWGNGRLMHAHGTFAELTVVGAERLHELDVGGAAHARDLRPERLGDLDGKRPDAARRPVDQHPRPGADARGVAHHEQRGEP